MANNESCSELLKMKAESGANHYLSNAQKKKVVRIACLYDKAGFPWAEGLIEYTIQALNNHTDGFFDDIFDSGEYVLDYEIEDEACNPDAAVGAYLTLTRGGENSTVGDEDNKNKIHAIMGGRCSGASVAMARIAAFDNIPMLSPSSTSPSLSEKTLYPTFSRLVAPDDARGQVGALVSLLTSFEWERVSIINTDSEFSKDMALEFKKAWKVPHKKVKKQQPSSQPALRGRRRLLRGTNNNNIKEETNENRRTNNNNIKEETNENNQDDYFTGQIGYFETIMLNLKNTDLTDKEVDPESVAQVLQSDQVENPGTNSRVIVLIAYQDQAETILKMAHDMGFQKDTIWIGVDAWTDRDPKGPDANNKSSSWIPPTDIPGYIGIAPYRNKTVYQSFLQGLYEYQQRQFDNNNSSRLPLQFPNNTLPIYADRLVDSVIALAAALSNVTADNGAEALEDGDAVVAALRGLHFTGVSGDVQFNKLGDWDQPKYNVLNLQTNNVDDGWVPIGVVEPGKPVEFSTDRFCFNAVFGCTTKIPIAVDKQRWSPIVTGFISSCVALLVLTGWYLYTQRNLKKQVKDEREKAQAVYEQIRTLEGNGEAAAKRRNSLYRQLQDLLQQRPQHWTPMPTSVAEDASTDGGNATHEVLVDVPATSEEYWNVLDQLRDTMGQKCYLSKLSRIQNDKIWSYYVFRKYKLATMLGKHINDPQMAEMEKTLFHGTSALPPEVIYADNRDVGFMLQYAQQGHWGYGIYFADRSGYSDCYCYRPRNEYSERDARDREMFIVKALIGEDKFMDREENGEMERACSQLVAPPLKPDGFSQYDSVSGKAPDGTKVFVVYENGRAYPEYLVRYYKSSTRDPSRTPFEKRQDAVESAGDSNTSATSAASTDPSVDQASSGEMGVVDPLRVSVNVVGPVRVSVNAGLNGGGGLQPASQVSVNSGPDVVWEFWSDDGWTPYDDYNQLLIESGYQENPPAAVIIEGEPFNYRVDTQNLVQENLDHPNKTRRWIRRVVSSGASLAP